MNRAACQEARGAGCCSTCEQRAPVLDPVNYDVWDLWSSVLTQWRSVAGMDRIVFLGLDYQAVAVVAEALDIEITPAILNKLRLLESKAMAHRNFKKGG